MCLWEVYWGVFSEEGNSACLSRCSGGLRPLVELCVCIPKRWPGSPDEALGEARPGQSSLSAGALRYRAWATRGLRPPEHLERQAEFPSSEKT